MFSLTRLFPTLLTILLIALIPAGTDAATPDRPNFIVILVDDMGWSDLGSYGSEIATPNLDRLASEGMRFRAFYNTSKCFPSRACLLTGRYAQEVGMSKGAGALTSSVTLGEALQPAGYYTVAVGKHHGRENLYDRGFDRYYGLVGGASNHFNPGGTVEMGFANKGGRDKYAFDEEVIDPYMPEEDDFYTTDYYTKWAIQLLDEKPADKENFLLYLSYTTPHDPLQAWPHDIAKYAERYNEGYEPIRKARWEKQQEMGLVTDKYELSDPTHEDWSSLSAEKQADQARRMAVYAAMVDSLDQNLGKLLSYLETKGYLENTVILFMSDNGSSAEVADNGYGEIGGATMWASLGRDWANVGNTPFRFYKNNSYEGGIRTPLIAWWPKMIEPGSFTDFPGHFIDVLPTLVDLAGAEYPTEKAPKPSGQSLLPAMTGEVDQRDGPLYFQWGRGKAMISRGWKIVQQGGTEWELYQLAVDPTETKNVADEHPEKVQEMADAWQAWFDQTDAGKNAKN